MTSIIPKINPKRVRKIPQPVKHYPSIKTNKKTIPIVEWFNNLPIRNKQLTALFTSELITVLGLIGVGSFLIINNGKSQLVNQVKSEIVVTQINYNIKIDQMGFGFRGQSDNLAIINAAKSYNETQTIPANLENQVKQILQNEIKAREIEYATLVGKDLKIIVNANSKRTGEEFDPNNLVSQVIINPEQIKTTEIVAWGELEKEKPPLPENFSQSDALIRYTLTPVKDRETGEVLGVLVSGDIVNNKNPIVQRTIEAFGSGYSGIYQINQSQNIQLTVSNYREEDNQPIEKNLPLDNNQLLAEAIGKPEETLTKTLTINGNNYTVAAKAIKNSNNQPVGILVKGTSEQAFEQLLRDSFLLQILVALIIIIVNIVIAILLGKIIANPLEALKQTAENFAQGNLGIRTKILNKDEIGELATTFNQMANSIENNELKILREQEETQLIANLNSYQILTQKDLEIALAKSLKEIRQFLDIDRLVIFKITGPEQLKLLAEAMDSGIDNLKNTKYENLTLSRQLIMAYGKSRLLIKEQNKLIKSGFYADHLQLMEQLETTANIVIPINIENKNYAFLMAQYCERKYEWQDEKVTFLKQFAQQIGIIIERFNFIEQQKLAQQKQQQEKEELQQKAFSLLKDIAPLSQGDLTVRALVSNDVIGNIANSYNTTIENLNIIVRKVKESAEKVGNTTTAQDTIVNNLVAESQAQTQIISEMLTKIEQINESIALVALNANQAQIATKKNLTTVEAGDEAMNRTVEGILGIKETVSQSTEEVNNLDNSIKRISKVVNLISKFAAQTHLLALKASIEAARAGEQGQGFAVIADEVRSLAAQSGDATEQIEIIVNEIQNQTKALVLTMATGTEKVETGTKLVKTAKENLTEIKNVTTDINQLIELIFVSIQEESQYSQVIKEEGNKVRLRVQNTSDLVFQVLEAFTQIFTVSQQLQETVAQFKVEEN
jgi:twitching motility protein PilJ/methyl-accepting chemotaxis protein PixJ